MGLSGSIAAGLEPGEMVSGSGLVTGYQRGDGGQQLPVADIVRIDVFGIAVEDAGANRSEMLVEEGFVRGAHKRTLADVAAAYAASDAESVPARKNV